MRTRGALRKEMLAAFLLLVLGVGLIIPILAVIRGGLSADGGIDWRIFLDTLSDPLYRAGLVNSFIVASVVTAGCIVLSVPLALLADRYDFWGKRFWLTALLVPMILPPFVGALGLKGLLARQGGINALLVHLGVIDASQTIDWLRYPMLTCIALEILYLYPITFLNVQAALAQIDPSLEEAAKGLGATRWRRIRTVVLPLLRPGVFAGSTLVFTWALTELGTPLVVGFRRITAVQVFDELQTTSPGAEAYALVCWLLLSSVVVYLGGKFAFGRPGGEMMAKATVASKRTRVGLVGSAVMALPFAAVVVPAALPHVGVVLNSVTSTGTPEIVPSRLTLQYHRELVEGLFSTGGTADVDLAGISIVNSVKYSAFSTALVIVFGFAIAYVTVRSRPRSGWLLDALAMLPLAVPGLVLAFGYFAMTQGESVLSFLDPLRYNPTPLMVIAYTFRRMPFLIRSCAAGLSQTSVALEEAAMVMGAGTFRRLLTIAIPLLWANIMAGALIVFARCMLEVSDSLILAFDREDYPMTKAMWSLVSIPGSGIEQASALGVWGMVLLGGTMALATILLGKRLGSLFQA